MNSLITSGPIRRLFWQVCLQTQGVAAPEWVASRTALRAPTRRQYAKIIKPMDRSSKPPQHQPPPPALKPTLPRATNLSARSTPVTASQPARLIFSESDVPLLPEWVSSLENLGQRDLTALHCMEGAKRYVSVATQRESLWRGQLEKEHDLSPYKLHWIGILLLSGNTSGRWKLGTHMLRSASELGFTPSTLTLVRIFQSMPAESLKRALKSELFIAANARFKDIVKEAADPDALTLQGIILAKNRDTKRAVAAFRRATEAWETNQKSGSANVAAKFRDASGAAVAAGQQEYVLPAPREPRWEWEVSCVLGLADILRGQGAGADAAELYRVAALELDHPRAFFQVAKMMGGPRDTPERRTYLLKAAISGEREACRELGQLEQMAAARKDLTNKDRAERDVISKEWLRLADGHGLSAIKNEAIQ